LTLYDVTTSARVDVPPARRMRCGSDPSKRSVAGEQDKKSTVRSPGQIMDDLHRSGRVSRLVLAGIGHVIGNPEQALGPEVERRWENLAGAHQIWFTGETES